MLVCLGISEGMPAANYNSHSYTFIERSVRHGVLEDLADHAVGPPEGTIRSVGSVTQPAKSTRTKFSVQDDAILRNWVAENPQKSGGTKGREIYIQLQAKVSAICDNTVLVIELSTVSTTHMAVLEGPLCQASE